MYKKIGVNFKGDHEAEFVAWAPLAKDLSLCLEGPIKVIPMQRDQDGFFTCAVEDIQGGTEYRYLIDGKNRRPDPASHFQPRGVFGPSAVVDHRQFKWEDRSWSCPELAEMIFYELHIGTFSPEGSFDGAILKLDYLCDLGVNAIELMPVAQFPGERNWGYDGVHPFAVQDSYGGPDGLKRFVNACHKKGIAVFLDVVYNHLGPEGNYLAEFMPVFSGKYNSPWGQAINFDDIYSHGVREYFIQNAFHWLVDYHVDGLRLDAVHGIFDMSARHVLFELSDRIKDLRHKMRRKYYLVAESDLNDARLLRAADCGGYGIDAQWNDDFHHCLHTLLTGERHGYYADFGRVGQLAKAIKEGFVYSWDYSIFRKKYHGSPSLDVPSDKFVVFCQNHDQVGNRPKGERLSALTSFDGLKLAAAVNFFSANIPLLFMGEEYGEEAPFNYFMSFQDKGLIEAVRRGRAREFSGFFRGEAPIDPYDEKTFLDSKLDMEKISQGKHRILFDYYKELIRIRKTTPAIYCLDKDCLDPRVDEEKMVLQILRKHKDGDVCVVFNFSGNDQSIHLIDPRGQWLKEFDSAEAQWLGPGPCAAQKIEGDLLAVRGQSAVLYRRGI